MPRVGPLRRLAVTASHVASPDEPLPKLRQLPDGSVDPEDLADLDHRIAAAATARDFRLAAQLNDTLEAVRPGRQPLALSDCTHTDEELQVEFFNRNGFCIVDGVYEGERLRQAQAAWLAAQQPVEERWRYVFSTAFRLFSAEFRPILVCFRSALRAEGTGRKAGDGLKYENIDAYRTFFDIPVRTPPPPPVDVA